MVNYKELKLFKRSFEQILFGNSCDKILVKFYCICSRVEQVECFEVLYEI